MNNFVTYEIPFSEKMKLLIKLEECFSKIKYNLHGTTKWNAEACLGSVIEILSILDKNDIKNILLKDLDKLEQSYTIYSGLQDVDNGKLEKTLKDISHHKLQLGASNVRLSTKVLNQDDLLSAIKQKNIYVNQLHTFDIPTLYYWLLQEPKVREKKIRGWLEHLHEIHSTANFVIKLIRSTAEFKFSHADLGIYQYVIPQNQQCQLVRVQLPIDFHIFPEVTGNKHRINIRFLTYTGHEARPNTFQESLDFDLAVCL